jgi:hypothetical protein
VVGKEIALSLPRLMERQKRLSLDARKQSAGHIAGLFSHSEKFSISYFHEEKDISKKGPLAFLHETYLLNGNFSKYVLFSFIDKALIYNRRIMG